MFERKVARGIHRNRQAGAAANGRFRKATLPDWALVLLLFLGSLAAGAYFGIDSLAKNYLPSSVIFGRCGLCTGAALRSGGARRLGFLLPLIYPSSQWMVLTGRAPIMVIDGNCCPGQQYRQIVARINRSIRGFFALVNTPKIPASWPENRAMGARSALLLAGATIAARARLLLLGATTGRRRETGTGL